MSARPPHTTEGRFGSRLGLMLSVLGIAVGTGNIWRFPRIVAQNGGDEGAGGFLVAWLVFLLVWSIPLIIAEYALGQRARRGVVGAFGRLSGGRLTWMGAYSLMTCLVQWGAALAAVVLLNGWMSRRLRQQGN